MIWFLSPDNAQPCGGIRTTYRHVDILNHHGLRAAVVHKQPGFRCNWFVHNTPVAYLDQVRYDPADLIALPGIFGPSIHTYMPGIRKVIWNQGVYLTFKGYSFSPSPVTPYTHPDVVATICMSEDSRQYLNYVFPHLRLFRLHYSIDPALFYPTEKRPQIAFMPWKNPDHVLQVVTILQLRGKAQGYELVPIDGVSETEAARHLREALIFLNFGTNEGFGLPPVEAMACGCAVIGYDGLGGREFFLPEHSFPVETGHIRAFVATIEHVLEMQRSRPGELAELRQCAVRFVREQYSPEQEEREVLACWRSLLAEGQA